MAKTLKKPKAKAKAKAKVKPTASGGKKSRKQVRDDAPFAGSNLSALGDAYEKAIDDLLNHQEKMDADMAGYRSEFATKYEKHAEKIGCPKDVLIYEFKRILARRREAERDAELEQSKRDYTEAMRASMEGRQYELFAEGELAPASAEAQQAAKERAEKTEAKETEEEGDVEQASVH